MIFKPGVLLGGNKKLEEMITFGKKKENKSYLVEKSFATQPASSTHWLCGFRRMISLNLTFLIEKMEI